MSHLFKLLFSAISETGCHSLQRLAKAAVAPLSGLDSTFSSVSSTTGDGGSGSINTTGEEIMKLPIGKYVETGIVLCLETAYIIRDAMSCAVTAWWAAANLFIAPVFYVLSSFFLLKDCDWATWFSKEKSDYWKNKVAWVTGASSGIGASLARSLAKRGVPVILSGRSTASLEKMKTSIVSLGYLNEEDVMVLPVELSDLDSIPAAVQSAIRFKGRVNILVNNAGMLIAEVFSGWQVSEDLLRVNLLAPIRLSQCVIPHMLTLASSSSPSDCHIVFINSFHGILPMSGRAMYATSKHGLTAYANSLSGELSFKLLEHPPAASFTTSAATDNKPTKAISNLSEENDASRVGKTANDGSSRTTATTNTSAYAYACSLISKFKSAKLVIPRGTSDVSVTTVYPGCVSTEISAKRIDTEHPRVPMSHNNAVGSGVPNRTPLPETKKGMSSERVAEVSLRAISNKLRNVWIGGMPDMMLLYGYYYAPETLSALSRFIEIYVCKRVTTFENSSQ